MTYDFSNEIYIPQTAAKLFRDSMEGRQFDDVAAVDGEFQAKHEDELVKQKMKEKYMEDVFTAKMNEHKALFEQILARTNVNPAQPPTPPQPDPKAPPPPPPGAQAFYIGDPLMMAPPPKPPPMKAAPKPAVGAPVKVMNPPKAPQGPIQPPKSPPPDPKRPLRGRLASMAKGIARSRSPIERRRRIDTPRARSQPAKPAPQTPELELTRLKRMGAAASSSQPLLSVMPARNQPPMRAGVLPKDEVAKGPPQKKSKDTAKGRPTGAASASKAAANDPTQMRMETGRTGYDVVDPKGAPFVKLVPGGKK